MKRGCPRLVGQPLSPLTPRHPHARDRSACAALFSQILPDERRGAENRGVLALNAAGEQLHFILEYGHHVLLHVPLRRIEKQFSRFCESAEEKNRFGRGDRNHVRERTAEHLARIAECLRGDGIALLGGRGDHRRIEILESRLAHLARDVHLGHELEYGALDARRRDIGLQTAVAAAAALAAAPLDDHMAQFACEAVVAVDHFAVGDETRAETRPERNHDEVLHALGVAEDHLSDRGGIGVVGHQDLHAREAFADVLRQRKDPTAVVGVALLGREAPQVDRSFDRPLMVVGVRSADADAHQLVFEREAVGHGMHRHAQVLHIVGIILEIRVFLG